MKPRKEKPNKNKVEHKIENDFLLLPPEELDREVSKNIRFLNSLLRIGEAPYEIESYVWKVESCLTAAMMQKTPFLPYQLVFDSIRSLVQYIYLYRWSRRSSITKLPGTWIADYMNIITDDSKVFWPPFPITVSQFFATLFSYLEERKLIENDVEVVLRVLRKFDLQENCWRAENFPEAEIVMQ